VKRGLLLSLCIAAAFAGPAVARAAAAPRVEVVVGLQGPPLAQASTSSRAFTRAARAARLNLRAPSSRAYVRELESTQDALARRIEATIPGAHVRWRYTVVANGLAVSLPASQTARLARIPGVARVYANVRYRSTLDRTPAQIGATALWGTDLEFGGVGLKIGIIDDGVDQTHTFFDPKGYAMPAGFPKGQTAFTTAKVIAARAFAPANAGWSQAGRPFDNRYSEHATHVAGIAAGNRMTVPTLARGPISGIAPRAYIGNYKVLTVPTVSGVGLDGNAPEIVAGIEAAVKDGMDVINLSLGEPEIEPSRDIVVQAINAAADAGVVPAIAAGNDYDEYGDGSVGSPGSAAKAITAASVSSGRAAAADTVSSFSSGGPTPVSLQLKPDVAAPGGDVLSSVPVREGTWAVFSGTSMASPHVAGAAALLRQRHPTWTVAQIKSALVLTGAPAQEGGIEARTTREGGGRIDLPKANNPLLFAAPTSASLGRVAVGARSTASIALTDAGSGAGDWTVTVVAQAGDPRVAVQVPATITVPGRLDVTAAVTEGAAERSYTGFVVLARGSDVRRIPYWLDVFTAALPKAKATPLAKPGVYRGTTAGKPSLVDAYRYPTALGRLAGPEQVYRVRIARPVANFGVVMLSAGQVQARIVNAGDESRQVGYTSLPQNMNPYVAEFGDPVRVSGALRPKPGSYDIVFDSPTRASAGAFRFRFWVDDNTPPALRVQTPRVASAQPLVVSATDAGSGVDPGSVHATVDGATVAAQLRGNRVAIETSGLTRRSHRLVLQVSDYQETRNNENVTRILPNTRVLRATFTVR
jgi:subtilisin family serine protease